MNKVFLFLPASKFMLALSQKKRNESLIFNLKHFPVGFPRSPLRKESQSVDAHTGQGQLGGRLPAQCLLGLVTAAAAHPRLHCGCPGTTPLGRNGGRSWDSWDPGRVQGARIYSLSQLPVSWKWDLTDELRVMPRNSLQYIAVGLSGMISWFQQLRLWCRDIVCWFKCVPWGESFCSYKILTLLPLLL